MEAVVDHFVVSAARRVLRGCYPKSRGGCYPESGIKSILRGCYPENRCLSIRRSDLG